MQRRICTLSKTFKDGTENLVEFVTDTTPNCGKILVRRTEYDGSKSLSICRNLSDQRIQRDIILYKEMGYREI